MSTAVCFFIIALVFCIGILFLFKDFISFTGLITVIGHKTSDLQFTLHFLNVLLLVGISIIL